MALDAESDPAAMERNLRLLPLHQACHNAVFWLPVFFLYFSSVLPLADVLLLEGAYYLFNVLLEVPSGWLSDRVGRRPTLLLAALGHAGGCALFVFTSSFGAFLLGQLGLAAAFAFVSGTDTALLYDSLKALGREDEIARREARMQAAGFAALAGACVVGGLVAGFGLRLVYGLAGLSAIVTAVVALRFVEPVRTDERAAAMPRQLALVLGRLGNPVLAWLFVFAIGMRVLNHVPYEFLQPYVGLVVGGADGWQPTPAVAGLLMGGTMGISAVASGRAVAVSVRFGAAATLLGVFALQAAIIAAMSALVHPALLPLLLLRSVPQALMRPVMNARIHPRVHSGIRATYFSAQQLAGSLVFSATLVLAAGAAGSESALGPDLLGRILGAYALGGAVLLVALVATARVLREPEPE